MLVNKKKIFVCDRKWYHLKIEADGNGIYGVGFQTCKGLRICFISIFIFFIFNT